MCGRVAGVAGAHFACCGVVWVVCGVHGAEPAYDAAADAAVVLAASDGIEGVAALEAGLHVLLVHEVGVAGQL